MDWILVRNKGEIERDALVLMGASTKRDEEGKIGLFGTGAKYALAVLLRHGVPVRIWSGTREIRLEGEPVSLRGKEFRRLVLVDGDERVPTSVTLEVGPTWTLWMAIRELLANAVDEGVIEVADASSPDRGEAGTTAVLIGRTEEVCEVWKGRDELIRLDTAPVFQGQKGAILPRLREGAVRIYKNRVLVGKYEGSASLWDYDLGDVPISEDRRVESWTAARHAERLVGESEACAGQVLDWVSRAEMAGLEGRVFERDFIQSYSSPSTVWAKLLEGHVMATREDVAYWGEDMRALRLKVRVLPSIWVEALKRHFPEAKLRSALEALNRAVEAREVKIEERGPKAALKRALQIMNWSGLKVDVPCAAVEFKDPAVLGKWDDKAQRILVARRVLDQGVRAILKVLVEEWAHQKSGASDCTRRLESFLVDVVVDQFIARKYAA